MPTQECSKIIRADFQLSIRRAERRDAARIEELVEQSEALDVNSCYAYLLLCEHFSATCLVADAIDAAGRPHDELAGFVTAYRPPSRNEAIFVWQIGVAPWARQRQLAKELLMALISQPACQDVERLEATIAPANVASQRLFASFAREVNAEITCVEGFSVDDFGGMPKGALEHLPEPLYQIGPIQVGRSRTKE